MAEATGTLRSVNPATGEELASYAEHTPGDLDAALAGADAAQRAWRRTSFAERRRCLEAAARLLREGRDGYAPPGHPGDGQADRRGRGRGRQVRLELRVRRRPGGGVPGRRARGDRCLLELRRLPAAGRGAGHHALELPVLAGPPVRRPGPDGRQRRPAQALAQRARLRRGRRGAVHPGRVPAGAVPDAAGHRRLGRRRDRAAAGRPAGRGGHPHRQRAGRGRGRRDRRAGPQEVRPGGGRVRPVPGPGRRRPSGGGRGRGQGAVPQRRAELHRGQAVRRRGARRRRVRAAVRRRGGRPARRRPARPGRPDRAAGPGRPAGRAGAPGREVGGRGRAGCCSEAGGWRAPGWFHAPTILAGVTPQMPVFREETFGPVAAVVRAADEQAAVELAAAGIREFTNIRTFWVQPAGTAPPATLTE